jgi:hypothetical protein
LGGSVVMDKRKRKPTEVYAEARREGAAPSLGYSQQE